MPEPRFLYWDASIFLSYLNNLPTRVETIEAILDNIGKNKEETIVTTIISKVEVTWTAHENLNRVLSCEEEDRIDSLWNDSSVIELIDFHDEIAILARNIMRQGMTRGWRLRTNDAIHLASAMWAQCYEINTYDSDWTKWEELINIPIREPSTIQPRLFTE